MDGESQRSQSERIMFMPHQPHCRFTRLRFDIQSLDSPLGGSGATSRAIGEGAGRGLPADRLLDDALRCQSVPRGMIQRLHNLVETFADDTAV